MAAVSLTYRQRVRLAKEIVDALFVDGARRLVLERPGKQLPGDGWSKLGALGEITRALRPARKGK